MLIFVDDCAAIGFQVGNDFTHNCRISFLWCRFGKSLWFWRMYWNEINRIIPHSGIVVLQSQIDRAIIVTHTARLGYCTAQRPPVEANVFGTHFILAPGSFHCDMTASVWNRDSGHQASHCFYRLIVVTYRRFLDTLRDKRCNSDRVISFFLQITHVQGIMHITRTNLANSADHLII
ncbi:Uncharacterised protein [Yersinia intermedia]|nr:Uncharacterised protein [Yersinia intermedia]